MKKMMGIWMVLFAVFLPLTIGGMAMAETHGTMMPDGSFIADQPGFSATPGVVAAPVVPIAAVATIPAPGSPATPTTNADGGHWWSGLLATVLAALASGLTALMAWMSNNAKTWIRQKASEANTKESAAWYATAMYLAGIAVKFAYDKYGKDDAKAEMMIKEASDYLMDRLRAIDKDIADPVKNPRMRETIEGLIRAARTEFFNALSPLAPGLAPKQV